MQNFVSGEHSQTTPTPLSKIQQIVHYSTALLPGKLSVRKASGIPWLNTLIYSLSPHIKD